MNASISLLALLFGVVQCFAGYSFLRFVLATIGFGFGAAVGASAAQLLSQNALVTGACGVLLGFAFLWVVTRLYLAGIFMLGALAGGALSAITLQMLGKSPFSVVVVLCALGWGVAAVVLQRWAVILATVAVGAAGCVISAHCLRLGRLDWQQTSWAEVVGGLALCVFGARRQLKGG